MSQRTTVTSGTWQQIGTGPATVQLIAAPSTEIMVSCAASAPTDDIDGLVLIHMGDRHTFTLTEPIWAQTIQAGASAVVAVQPEAS